MANKINIIYISLNGNTKYFVECLSEYIEATKDIVVESLNIKDLKGETFPVDEPFVSFLPTYLNGGNGIHTGDKEVLTTRLGDFIVSNANFKFCYGIVGSGNRNFNNQFCLSAKQYAERFGFPLIDVFELRGTQSDVERIANLIINHHEEFLNEL
ncbi:class Ib ribonucleoside-diphosphate reductase assembly flavoprotein NrdI [Carnobacterium jeotgali]